MTTNNKIKEASGSKREKLILKIIRIKAANTNTGVTAGEIKP